MDAPGPSSLAPDAVDRARHPSGIVPTLQNVVATVNLDCKLDLKNIALHARNAEYNPKVSVEILSEMWAWRMAREAGRGRGEKKEQPRPAPASTGAAILSRHSLFSPRPFSVSRPSSCASGTPRRPP